MKENQYLKGPFILGNKTKKVKNIVAMLHGYGSNGSDLIQIAKILEIDFPNTHFFAPNAPFKYEKNTDGYMWFEAYPNGIHYNEASEQQKKNVKIDFDYSCRLIKHYIKYLLDTYAVNLNKFFLLGFSQGSMMSLEVGTSLNKPIGGIISLSGRIWGDDFDKIDRNKSPILIVHGEEDQIIKPFRYHETCNILEKSNFKVKKYLLKEMGHTINNDVIKILKNFL